MTLRHVAERIHVVAAAEPVPAAATTDGHHASQSTLFRRFALVASEWLGSSWAFAGAFIVILAWAASGPVFGFSSNWQLVINTGTTIVTFLMVFLVQNTQNRDTLAMNLKLDELLRGTKGARTTLVHLEDLSDEDLHRLRDEFQALAERSGGVFESATEDVEEELADRGHDIT